ncbi:small subunit ribosomal protein S9 [Desulfosarcina sp. BuS5]|jgi:small subunit ribosomal protein S9|uniref:30S ribosomal protein S9 n=1 Tax=Desulfosarcina sp. BuS5 TaxID=933262 RepID=UPI0004826DE2|nr:30S ribosomal protein S9 [Desulfosarcina sp. BuS5]WDN90857.1 small subunit ribosomal protein S9 [Desulfosarcina sp. BuS5]
MEQENTYYATGRRKKAIARTWLKSGTGNITINKRSADNYFSVKSLMDIMAEPLVLTDNLSKYDVVVTVKGGGSTGQAGAIRHGITRALMLVDPDLRTALKKAGFVRRDSRVKERKKYGQKGARARFQFSKR